MNFGDFGGFTKCEGFLQSVVQSVRRGYKVQQASTKCSRKCWGILQSVRISRKVQE